MRKFIEVDKGMFYNPEHLVRVVSEGPAGSNACRLWFSDGQSYPIKDKSAEAFVSDYEYD